MTSFRILLIALWAIIAAYTAVTISSEGWNLLPIFFGDVAAMKWPGQFNTDFSSFLILSAFWVMWRHHFSAGGIALGLIASVGGGLFFTAYLFVISLIVKGDAKKLLLGERRAAV
jgi:hypothetical protein